MSNDSPRLYLITPRVKDAAAFAPLLQAAMAAGDVACVLLRYEARDEGDAKKIVKALGDIVQPSGAALLIENDSQIAVRANADGVNIRGLGPAFEDALERLRPDRIVGISGVKSRDDAMSAGEQDVDYIMYGEPTADGYVPPVAETLERVGWWAQLFNVPCVGYASVLADVAPLVAAGADFVALGDAVWNDPRGVDAAVREAQAVVDGGAKAA